MWLVREPIDPWVCGVSLFPNSSCADDVPNGASGCTHEGSGMFNLPAKYPRPAL